MFRFWIFSYHTVIFMGQSGKVGNISLLKLVRQPGLMLVRTLGMYASDVVEDFTAGIIFL